MKVFVPSFESMILGTDREVTKMFVFASLIASYDILLVCVKFNFGCICYHIKYTFLLYYE